MELKEIILNGKEVLVEVAELDVRNVTRYRGGESVDSGGQDLAKHIEDLVATLSSPVQAAFKGSGAEEWSMEVNVGFKGETGLPFIAKGEANAAVKVMAKWKKVTPSK